MGSSASIVTNQRLRHMFVIVYEEPTLRGKFGADYEDYCRNVTRCWPRLRAWDKP